MSDEDEIGCGCGGCLLMIAGLLFLVGLIGVLIKWCIWAWRF